MKSTSKKEKAKWETKGQITGNNRPLKERDDSINYKYPLKLQDRCQNALVRWSQYCEEHTQPECNIIHERTVKAALGYNIAVKYNSDLPEARALPTSVKEKLEGYEAADAIICRVKKLIAQLEA